jgi:hypothetical protein
MINNKKDISGLIQRMVFDEMTKENSSKSI